MPRNRRRNRRIKAMGDAVEPPFPTEIWELIFRHCSVLDLTSFRLVCHRWNAMVMGCPSFRSRCRVRFCRAELQDTTELARPLWTRDEEYPFEIIVLRVDIDWPEFGQYLQNLSLDLVFIRDEMLFRMLRFCQNLKRLKLNGVAFLPGACDNQFQLETMEEFTMTSCAPSWYIGLFRSVLPRLKTISIVWAELSKTEVRLSLIQFIQNVQGTLQTLTLEYYPCLLEELCGMTQLHLKQATLIIGRDQLINIDLWTRFCQAQQSLEDLSLIKRTVSNELLCVTVQNLPNLKKLRANLWSRAHTVPTFLSHLSRVENVDICADDPFFDLRIPLSPSLKEFRLSLAGIYHGIETLTTSPTLQKLTLERCYLAQTSVSSSLPKGTSLKHLALIDCSGLRAMKLHHILGSLPLLETVRLQRVCFGKETIPKLLRQCPKLREVILEKCDGYWDFEEDIMSDYYSLPGVAEGSRKVRFVHEEVSDDDDY